MRPRTGFRFWYRERNVGQRRSHGRDARAERRGGGAVAWSPRLNVAWPLAGGVARLAAGRVTQPPRLAELELALELSALGTAEPAGLRCDSFAALRGGRR
jgi:hypothetical protein